MQKVAELVLHLADLRAAGDGGDGLLHGGDGAARLPPQRQLLRRPRPQPREPPPLPPRHARPGENHIMVAQQDSTSKSRFDESARARYDEDCKGNRRVLGLAWSA